MRKRSLSLLAAPLLAIGLLTLAPTVANAAGSDVVISPGDDVKAALESLRPGDQLRLQPGTYDVRGLGPALTPGPASQPIVVTAVDGSRPPLIRGYVFLNSPSFWTLQYLKFQATVADRSTLVVAGGSNWTVRKSEFTGASSTRSYANVAISNGGPNSATSPTHWSFSDNCVHDAGPGIDPHTPYTDHNIYVNASGSAPGLIARNLLLNAPAGAQVKVGYGDSTTTPGASGVLVAYNTMYDAGRQIAITGTLSAENLKGNLLVRSTAELQPSGMFLLHLRTSRSVTMANNFAYLMGTDTTTGENISAHDSAPSTYVNQGDNTLHSANEDPLMSGGDCSGYLARNTAVKNKYGRQATAASGVTVP